LEERKLNSKTDSLVLSFFFMDYVTR